MSMKVKGLLKGLRYISTIFDDEEEGEMQIGFPTDVKHVAHIGWDGPTANSPSWISQFKEGDSEGGGGGGGPPNVDQQPAPKTRGLSVQEKRFSTGSDSPLESPSRKRSDKPKGSRRANSASAADSPRRSSTSSENKTKQQQQQLSAAEGDSNTAGPKTSTRRKKPKSGSSSGQSSSKTPIKPKSTGPSSETSQYSDPGTGRRKGKDTCQSSVLKISSEQEDQKALDDISRGIQAM